MSFLKISDPAKRDAMVKEYLELKKNIRDNLLSERTGELELQTDLSKFYRPITETQKATTREIRKELWPIRRGIEKLPQAIQPIREGIEKLPQAIQPITEGIEKLPQAIQPIREATGEEEEEEEEEWEEGEKLARTFLKRKNRDENFGIREEKGRYYIGNKPIRIINNDIILDDELILGTPGLWELITSKNPQNVNNPDDYANYRYLLLKTNAIYKDNNPESSQAKGNHKGKKWENIIGPIWHKELKPKEGYQGYKIPQPWYEGKGVVVIPSDPNALLERLDLLLASQDAGHTGVGNELISICDELKRQGVLDMKTYKKINSIIKK